MPLVIDANVAVVASLAPDGFALFGTEALVVPDLLLWEAASTLHEYLWRIDASRRTPDMATLRRDDVLAAFEQLKAAPLEVVRTDDPLLDASWEVSTRCGFARVYDGAYVALARLRQARLVTLDGRLKSSPAARLVTIIGPTEV